MSNMLLDPFPLEEAIDNIENRTFDTLFVSLGCHVGKQARPAKVLAQQYPNDLLRGQSLCLLVDPMFARQDPAVFKTFDDPGFMVVKRRFLSPLDATNVVFMVSSDFAQDGGKTLQRLVGIIRRLDNTDTNVYLGDFTVTGPYSPFQEYPHLKEELGDLSYVYWSTDHNSPIYERSPSAA